MRLTSWERKQSRGVRFFRKQWKECLAPDLVGVVVT